MALAVTTEGSRDILGLWAGDGGEGAKFWLNVCTELKNRGVGPAVASGPKSTPTLVNRLAARAALRPTAPALTSVAVDFSLLTTGRPIERTVTAPMFRREGQSHQGPHRSIRA